MRERQSRSPDTIKCHYKWKQAHFKLQPEKHALSPVLNVLLFIISPLQSTLVPFEEPEDKPLHKQLPD